MLFLPRVEPTRCCKRIPERKDTTCTMEHYPLAERHMSWIGTSPLLASNSTKHAEVLGRRLRVRSSSFIIRYLASPVVEPANKLMDGSSSLFVLLSSLKMVGAQRRLRCLEDRIQQGLIPILTVEAKRRHDKLNKDSGHRTGLADAPPYTSLSRSPSTDRSHQVLRPAGRCQQELFGSKTESQRMKWIKMED